jgi:hypothetical protein
LTPKIDAAGRKLLDAFIGFLTATAPPDIYARRQTAERVLVVAWDQTGCGQVQAAHQMQLTQSSKTIKDAYNERLPYCPRNSNSRCDEYGKPNKSHDGVDAC